jgi:PAS domain-containing protein
VADRTCHKRAQRDRHSPLCSSWWVRSSPKHVLRCANVRATLARALIESAAVAIYHTHAAGRLTYVNAEYRRIFGLTP